MPRYADGSSNRPDPLAYPENWCAYDIIAMAHRLEGHLMIAAGELDENVPMTQAIRLIDALTRANKPCDFMLIPRGTHAWVGDALRNRTHSGPIRQTSHAANAAERSNGDLCAAR